MKTVRPEISAVLHRGLECCRRDDWNEGLLYLGQLAEADRSDRGSMELPGLFYSYLGYGIARCQGKVKEGLKLCQHAIKVEFYEAENYVNLARTCLLAKDRSGAVRAVREGLKVDRQSLELQALYRELGIRREPVLGFLSRTHPLNMLLGRIRSALKP